MYFVITKRKIIYLYFPDELILFINNSFELKEDKYSRGITEVRNFIVAFEICFCMI